MIDKDAKVIGHVSPYRRINIQHLGRPRTITREQIEDNIHREPCAEAYNYDYRTDVWTLKD